jgi:hypothetical protein
MNERMLELYRRAQVPGIAIDPTNNMHYETTYFSAEKFAELIVLECMKAADDGMAQVTMRVEWPSYHIKKHFGVEE